MHNSKQNNLTQGIFNYLEMLNTGALLVTGSWGCGKSYYFENTLFGELREEDYKPVRVSLFGISSLNDLSKSIVCECAQYVSDKGWLNKSLKFGTKALTKIEDLNFINDFVDVKSIWGEGKALYKLVPEKAVICLDDLERAVEKFDINDLLGVINELVENQRLKVIVIANKEYIDERSEKTDAHEIFYEKVIEKTLHFEPCLMDVFDTLITVGDEEFQNFMRQEPIKNSVNPILAKSKRIKRQKENIRTLKFAISHFKVLFDDYVKKGVDVAEEKTNRMLVNQWLFVYSIALESKNGKLGLDECMGLDSYVYTAKTDGIAWGDDEESDDLFKNDETVDGSIKENIGKRFVDDYYGDKAVEYVFYPDIYKFILGGINYDIAKHLEYAKEAFKRFDYKTNPAQEELGKWMKGYWMMTDDEASESLRKLLEYVRDGQLADFVSYYNASIFLLKCCEIMDVKEYEVLNSFDVGLRKFAANVELNAYMLSTIKVLPVEKNEPVGKVYAMIEKVIHEKEQENRTHDEAEMMRLFKNNMEAFVGLFVPKGHVTPKYFNIPMLHLLSEQDIHHVVDNAQPNDIMNLYYMVGLRFNNDLIEDLKVELPFITCLKSVIEQKAKDRTKLSFGIMRDQLLPALEKVYRKMISFQQEPSRQQESKHHEISKD